MNKESDSFLQPILEELSSIDIESQTVDMSETESDSIFILNTYKSFTGYDWFKCCKITTLGFFILCMISFIIYICIDTYLHV